VRIRTACMTTMSVLALTALASCTSADAKTEEQSYEVTEQVKSLTVDAQAAAVTVEVGHGPVTVTESYHFSNDKPRTSHQVSGTDLRLTDSGCARDESRCGVEFEVRVPASTAVSITTRAGAVELTDLEGDVTINTDAGAIEGTGLGGEKVSVTTEAGATSLQFAEAPTSVTASTELGAISVKVPGGTAYAVEASTGAGRSDIRVQQDPASPHKISLKTNVGAIRVENG
jgi:Putative adhesin